MTPPAPPHPPRAQAPRSAAQPAAVDAQAPPAAEAGTGADVGVRADARDPIEIVSPFQRDRYRLSEALPAGDQRIMVKARPGDRTAFVGVTLYVDDRPLASIDGPPYRAWWPLQLGEHRIYAVGETGAGTEVVSKEIVVIVVQG